MSRTSSWLLFGLLLTASGAAHAADLQIEAASGTQSDASVTGELGIGLVSHEPGWQVGLLGHLGTRMIPGAVDDRYAPVAGLRLSLGYAWDRWTVGLGGDVTRVFDEGTELCFTPSVGLDLTSRLELVATARLGLVPGGGDDEDRSVVGGELALRWRL